MIEDFKDKSGIYKITSPSEKMYIGSAIRFKKRWHLHLHKLRHGKHENSKLQKSFNKYGECNLKFSILLICSKHDLLFFEQRVLDILKPEYNICTIAGSSFGVKRSEITKSKQRAPKTKQHCENLSKALLKSLGTEEARRLNSERQKIVQGTLQARLENSARQKIAQNRPEVSAKKAGRQILCVETGQIFPSGHHAAEWCIMRKLTTNKNAFVWINRAVRDNILAYGLNWKAVQL